MSNRSSFSVMQRRSFLTLGASSVAAALAGRWFDARAARADEQAPAPARAKSTIVLWMNGGPSHLDTFDPKPGTGAAGPAKAIPTAAAGVKISEHLPQLAAQASRLCFLRGMTSKEGNHQRAQELGRTGHTPNPTVKAPALGAWVSKYEPRPGLELPGFVALNGPSFGAGILGHECDPLTISSAGDLPDDLSPFQEIASSRDEQRRAALAMLDGDFSKRTGDAEVTSRSLVRERATKMMRSRQIDAFSIAGESEAVKKAYGDTAFGRGCLTARRLVEIGVPFVEVTLDGWDTHQNNFDRTKGLMGALDPAAATLLGELEQRGLLDHTLVVWMGDFGRTPTINANDGRDHFPGAWSAWMAGAGVRGGHVHGETDAQGAKVTKDPTTVPDLLATISKRMGVDPLTTEHSPRGRPITVTDGGQPIDGIFT